MPHLVLTASEPWWLGWGFVLLMNDWLHHAKSTIIIWCSVLVMCQRFGFNFSHIMLVHAAYNCSEDGCSLLDLIFCTFHTFLVVEVHRRWAVAEPVLYTLCYNYIWHVCLRKLQNLVAGCKPYAVWNIRSIFPSPTGFPVGHQVYDLHNDGNSVLQFGRVPHRSVSRRQMWLPIRYYGLYPPIFVLIHVE